LGSVINGYLGKLSVDDRTQAAVTALRKGLVK
jgi:DNA-binding NarL/FixJ family response regulator